MHKEYKQFAQDHTDEFEALHKLKGIERVMNDYSIRKLSGHHSRHAKNLTSGDVSLGIPRNMAYITFLHTQVAKLAREAATLSVPDLDNPSFWIAMIDDCDRTPYYRFTYTYDDQSNSFLEYKGDFFVPETLPFMISTAWTLAVFAGHDDATQVAFTARTPQITDDISSLNAFPSLNFQPAFASLPISALQLPARRLQKIEPMVLDCMAGNPPYDAYGVKPGGDHGHILKNTPRDISMSLMDCAMRLGAHVYDKYCELSSIKRELYRKMLSSPLSDEEQRIMRLGDCHPSLFDEAIFDSDALLKSLGLHR